jgi:hypothetical protein
MSLRSLAKRIPGYYPMHEVLARRRQEREYREWIAAGRPVPPPHLAKRKVLQAVAKEHGLTALVETGTFYGEMIAALRGEFSPIYTIELSSELHTLAARRFRRWPHIHAIQGDSGERIADILPLLDRPTLFWLDGHYSADVTARGALDTPILQELRHILDAPDLGHALVIDDARDFGSDPCYPTIETVKEFVLSRRPGMDCAIDTDSIRFTPRRD